MVNLGGVRGALSQTPGFIFSSGNKPLQITERFFLVYYHLSNYFMSITFKLWQKTEPKNVTRGNETLP